VQHVVRICLHPAIARDPCGPEDLNLLREGSKLFLQSGDASLGLLRTQDERDAREPGPDVEVVHSGAVPADERSLTDRSRKRLDGEGLNAVPQGCGRREEVLLGLVVRLVVEKCVEP
jgi:hypothetical protein